MTDGTNRLVIFGLHGGKYALYLRQVAEVVEPPRIFPMPNAPLFFLGVMNFHGNLAALLDLALFLLNVPRNPDGKILVLDTGIANLGLWVDAVENVGAADIVLEEFESDEALVDKVLIMADGEVKLLSAEKLLAQLEDLLAGEFSGA